MRLRTVINYQWSRHRGTHHVIGLHQDSCITHSSLYSHLRNRYICSWSVHLKVAFRLQSKTFCRSKVWPMSRTTLHSKVTHPECIFLVTHICLGLSTSNLWGKKDNFNEWMQYTIHFNAFILKPTESTDHSLQNWKSLLIETVRWIDSDFIALIYIWSHVVSFVVMEHVVHLFKE